MGGRPSIGSVAMRLQGSVDKSVPPFVGLAEKTQHAPWSDSGKTGFLGSTFGAFKPKLADLAVSVMGPIGAEMRRLLADPGEIDRILALGGEKARDTAAPTLAQVKKIVGYWAG